MTRITHLARRQSAVDIDASCSYAFASMPSIGEAQINVIILWPAAHLTPPTISLAAWLYFRTISLLDKISLLIVISSPSFNADGRPAKVLPYHAVTTRLDTHMLPTTIIASLLFRQSWPILGFAGGQDQNGLSKTRREPISRRGFSHYQPGAILPVADTRFISRWFIYFEAASTHGTLARWGDSGPA